MSKHKTKHQLKREADRLLETAPNAETIVECRDRLAEIGEKLLPAFNHITEHVGAVHGGLLTHLDNVQRGQEDHVLKVALQENDMPTALRIFREHLGDFEAAWDKYHRAVKVASLYGL